MSATKRLMTAPELADHLRLGKRAVSRLTRSGRIPSVRISRRAVRYDLEAVMAALGEPPEGESASEASEGPGEARGPS
jgi:excisionase family DNA binding protein